MTADLTILTTADASPAVMTQFAEAVSRAAFCQKMKVSWRVVDGLHAYDEVPASLRHDDSFALNWIRPDTPLPQLSATMIGLSDIRGNVMIMDPDMWENIEDVPLFMAAHEEGYTIVFGRRVRRYGTSKLRHYLTRLFNAFARHYLKLPLHDFNSPMVSISREGLDCLLSPPKDCPSPRLHACYQMADRLTEVEIQVTEHKKLSSYTTLERLKLGIVRVREILAFHQYVATIAKRNKTPN